MTTPSDIVNRAIQFIGGFNNNGAVTGAPPSFDGSAVGVAAGTLYNGVVQTVARQFGWDFDRAIVTLASTGGAAPMGYSQEYHYPTNGVQVRQLLPTTISDVNNPVPQRWTVGNVIGNSNAASGTITFSINPSNNATITLNGIVWTFVSGTPSGNQTQIQGTVAFTIATLASDLDASVNPFLTVASYVTNTAGVLSITYNTAGLAGNSYTLAASAAVVSGATLSGGTVGQMKVIWTSLANAVAVYTNQPNENTWDALFTEAVVRLLASELALALPGKPESSQLVFGQFGEFEQAGEQRLDS